MKYILALIAAGIAIASSTSVLANDLTANVGVASDYVLRGISQTQHKAQVSGGLEYSMDNGMYVGTWVSNQNWVNTGPYKGNSSLEWDQYVGYRDSVGPINYDVGVINYYYTGDRSKAGTGIPTPDTTEAYIGGSYNWIGVKYSQAISKHFIGWGSTTGVNTRGSNYVELNLTPTIGSWGLIGHIGHQKVSNFGSASYSDWKVGINHQFGPGVVAVTYTDTNADVATYTWNGTKVGKATTAVSYNVTF